MVDHQVYDHADAAAVGGSQKLPEVVHAAKKAVHGAVVGYVVAKVPHGTLEEGADPQSVHTKL